jgi:hypothetical protein
MASVYAGEMHRLAVGLMDTRVLFVDEVSAIVGSCYSIFTDRFWGYVPSIVL